MSGQVSGQVELEALWKMEDDAFAELSAASMHLLMRARSLGRHHLTDEEMESLAPLRAALDAAIAARRSAEAQLSQVSA